MGEKKGSKIIDDGKLYSVEQALENGIITRIAEPETAFSEALEESRKLICGDFAESKKERNGKISASVGKCLADEDSKNLAAKLSSSETIENLEKVLETLKKGK